MSLGPGRFTGRLAPPDLGGIVMATALHFVRRKEPVLEILRSYLKPHGRLILVEYNADSGNRWVPFPPSFPRLDRLASRTWFSPPRLPRTLPGRSLRAITPRFTGARAA